VLFCFGLKVGGQTALEDPALQKVGGQLTPLTRRLRGHWCLPISPNPISPDIVLPTFFDTIHLVAMSINKHFLPRDARAKRGIAIVSRPSVCLSVRNVELDVCRSV